MSAEASSAGNSLSVSAVGPAFPSAPFIADFYNGDDFFTCNPGGTYYPEEIYAPCAQITFSDAVSGLATPNNNSATAVIYDACGNVAGGSTTYGWYTVGDPQGRLTSGGHAGGLSEWISPATPPSCAGVWTIVYGFTQTFTNGETLSASASGTFIVKPVQIIGASETWGGGNPAQLVCQPCVGDPVNTASGDYWESTTDLAIEGRGPGLRMERSYSSLAAAAGRSSVLGPGWSFNYGMSLAIDSGTGTATITNGNGSQTVFTREGSNYVAPGRALATLVRNSDGTHTYTERARTVYVFNAAGKLTSIADLNGNKTTLAYNAAGRLATASDGAARTLTFSYDASGRLASVADSTGRQVIYTHDTAGDLTSVTDVRGGQWSFGYDSQHLMLTRIDANGNLVMTNTYDPDGRALTQTDGLGRKTTLAYTGNPSTATRVTDPNGHVTEYEFANGLLMRKTRAPGTTEAASWSYSYDRRRSLGVTEVIDPNGHWRSFAYDERGNQTSATDSLGNTVRSSYDSLNNLTSRTDANGVTTTATYDTKGNVLTRSTPLSGTTQTQTVTYVYGDRNRPGEVTAIKNPLGNSTAFTYDAAGNLATVTNPAGNKTTYTYNARGQRLTMVRPRGNVKGATPSQFTTTYTYDAVGNLLTTTDALGRKTTSTYDANGNLTSVTDPKSNKTTYAYDVANQRTTITRADGTTLLDSYDGNGNLVSQTDGAGRSTVYAYDALDHLTSVTDPLNRTTSYRYDAAGNMRSLTDPLNRTTSYGYDAADRLTQVNYSDASTSDVSFGYDGEGRRTSMSDGTGTSTYTYDSLGRLTTATNGHGDTTSFAYDIAGNQTSITYPNAKTVSRTFDAARRTASLTDWLGNKTSFAYDADSNLTTTTFPTSSSTVDTYAFDTVGQATLTTFKRGTTTLASLTYASDANGQLTTETPTGLPGGAQSYSYNALNQLTQAAGKSYAYDAADNPTTLAGVGGYAYDAANQLTQSPVAAYTYDAVGNRITETQTAGGSTTYTYDQGGRLTAVGGATTAAYTYDGDGLRASKTTNGTTAHHVWDPTTGNLLWDGTNSYIYGPDGAAVEHISSGGTVTYYHHDRLGSTRLLTGSTGTTTGSFNYDAYGNPNGSTGTSTTPLRYAGQYTDAETGFQYLRARYYDPRTAQFISRDAVFDLTRQRYTYANGNPINATDPSGLLCIDPTGLTCGVQEAVSDGVGAAADFVYDNAGTISSVSSALAFAPPLAPIAGPLALATGALQGYKNVQSGNYAGAALDALGLVTGGAAMRFDALASRTGAAGRGLFNNPTVGGWLLSDAAEYARRARWWSYFGFTSSNVLSQYVNPDVAYAAPMCSGMPVSPLAMR